MSRLSGRVVFPGAAENDQPASSDARREISPGAQENFRPIGGDQPRRRGRGFNQTNNQGPQKFERQERQQPAQQQKNERAQRNERNERYERFDRKDRFEKNQRHERPQQSEQYRTERSERFDREDPAEKTVQKPRKPTEKIENVVASEELLEVEDIIAQISDLTVRSDRSAVQIKRNILGSSDLLDTMSEDDWQTVCESMIGTAIEQGEPEFIADIIVALINNGTFPYSMSDELMVVSSKFIMKQEDTPIPAFLAAILCAHWPRHLAKAFDNVNPVLFTVVSIIKGWILVVTEDTERYHKEEKKPKYPVRVEEEEDEKKEEEVAEEEEKIIEDPAVVNQCALALSDLCDTAQRQLWVSWMGVTDEIYQCVKPAITHNPNIRGDIKERLLNTFVQMNQWTKSRSAPVKHAQVQTVSTSSE